MAILTPVNTPTPIRQDQAYFLGLRNASGRLEADFGSGPKAATVVRVTCDGVIQAKLTDETVFSITENLDGNSASGFAYSVENGQMLGLLPDAAKRACGNLLRHYLVISLNECLEFLSTKPPRFELIES